MGRSTGIRASLGANLAAFCTLFRATLAGRGSPLPVANVAPTQIQDLWVCLHGRSRLRGVTSRGQLGVANCSPPALTPLKRASVPATDQTWRRTAGDCGRSCEVVPAARPHRASEIGALQPITANRNAPPWLPFSRASRTAISTACVPCSTRAGFARG